jgi:hypothetical protein
MTESVQCGLSGLMQVQLTKDNEKLIEEYSAAMKRTNATYSTSATSIVNVFFAEIILAKIKALERGNMRRSQAVPA